MEHDALGLVGALGDVVLLPLVRHDLPRHADGRGGHQDAAPRHGGRHAHAGQRQAAPGREGRQAEPQQGQRASLGDDDKQQQSINAVQFFTCGEAEQV